MPTINPQLKIATSCQRDLSANRHEAKKMKKKSDVISDDDIACSSIINSINKDSTVIRNMQYDDYLRRKVSELRSHIGGSHVQRNASDTSLLWAVREDEEVEDSERVSNTTLDPLNNTSEQALEPSVVPCNLRNARARSAFQIMEEYLSRGSVESTQGDSGEKVGSQENSGGVTDLLQVSQMKAKRKPTKFTPSRKQIDKQKERINSTGMDNNTSKPLNIYSKSLYNSKLGLSCPAIEDCVPLFKGFHIQGKVKSDLSINIAPYPLKSSKDHLSPYQPNSSAARIKNYKRTAHSFERVVRRTALQGDEQVRLKKVYLTKIQSDDQVGASNDQSSSKPDRESSCENGSVLSDIKPAEAKRLKPKPEAKVSQRERTNSEENKQSKAQSKVMRYELKRQQRREIYALNKVMTDLENERFILFMQEVNSNTPVGDNGAGKTTLLKLLLADLEPCSGFRHAHRNLRIGYFSQHHVDQLDMSVNSVQLLANRFPGQSQEVYRNQLGSFGVSGDLALRPVSSLSGGQKSRVAFAVMSMTSPNFFILDEPTNHLDMETIEALGDALNKFQGGVILVSHDERLIRNICKELWVVSGGKVTSLEGGIDEYKRLVLMELESH